MRQGLAQAPRAAIREGKWAGTSSWAHPQAGEVEGHLAAPSSERQADTFRTAAKDVPEFSSLALLTLLE